VAGMKGREIISLLSFFLGSNDGNWGQEKRCERLAVCACITLFYFIIFIGFIFFVAFFSFIFMLFLTFDHNKAIYTGTMFGTPVFLYSKLLFMSVFVCSFYLLVTSFSFKCCIESFFKYLD
jgi:hypothetical protein